MGEIGGGLAGGLDRPGDGSGERFFCSRNVDLNSDFSALEMKSPRPADTGQGQEREFDCSLSGYQIAECKSQRDIRWPDSLPLIH